MSTAYEQNQAFGRVIDVLEAVGATYAIWGGLAVVAYGEARFTQDMDILLQGERFPVTLFVKRLKEAYYHVDELAVQNALFGGFFNVIHLHYHIKTDFYVPTESVLQTMLKERVYLPFDEMRRAAYITETAVIIAKLRAYEDSDSTRHLDDIASIIRVQGKQIDAKKVDIIAAQLGVFSQWRMLWETHQR